MSAPDFNLLIALDVLLSEGSVARAAKRLGLSPSAMSRALTRLRETTGDPLLVRAGRTLVPTPRALELRERVGRVVEEARVVLRPMAKLDLARLDRTFTLRTSEGFVENFGAALLARVRADAPGVRLRFAQKPDKDSKPLRDGTVDLETGVVEASTGPELRARALFEDRLVGVVRSKHPLVKGKMTVERFAVAEHVNVSRAGSPRSEVDDALNALGHHRTVVATVDGFAGALALARRADLVATVPERHTGVLRDGMHTFELPVSVPTFTVSLLWHPRLQSDPPHQWLRKLVLEVCTRSN